MKENEEMSLTKELLHTIIKNQNSIIAEIANLKEFMIETNNKSNLQKISKSIHFQVNAQRLDCNISNKTIDTIFEIELPHIVEDLSIVFGVEDNSSSRRERAGPGDLKNLINGHYKTMLKRYIFFRMHLWKK